MGKYQTAIALTNACMPDPLLDNTALHARFDELTEFLMLNFDRPSWDDEVGVETLFNQLQPVLDSSSKDVDAMYDAAVADPTTLPEAVWPVLLIRRVMLSHKSIDGKSAIDNKKAKYFKWINVSYGPYMMSEHFKEALERGRKWEKSFPTP